MEINQIMTQVLSSKSSEDQKINKQKGLHQKFKDVYPLNRVKTKKKSFPQYGNTFGRHRWDLLVLPGTVSSDYPALKSRWGTLYLDVVTLTLDGGRRPPYNLSTGLQG